jgi:hypothetical protein
MVMYRQPMSPGMKVYSYQWILEHPETNRQKYIDF